MSTIKASIDIGSNSTLLLIAKVDSGKVIKSIERLSEVTALGHELDTNKVFHPQSMKDTLETLKKYTKVCSKYGLSPENIIATATEASRVSQNGQDFYSLVEKETGLKVSIISGEAEAMFSALGILTGVSSEISHPIVIMDIGGASTEFIKVDVGTKEILDLVSLPIGSVRANSWIKMNSFKSQWEELISKFDKKLKKFKTHEMYCVAGTMTSAGNMFLESDQFIEDDVHDLCFNFQNLLQIKEKSESLSSDELLKIYPFLGKRSKTINAGLLVSTNLLSYLGVERIRISTYGLRYGTIVLNTIEEKYLYGKTACS